MIFSKLVAPEKRFKLGMKLLAQIDQRYSELVNDLYKSYRCGMLHVFKPGASFVLSERKNLTWEGTKMHLKLIEGKVILICEDFYDDIASAFKIFINDPKFKNKLEEPFISVTVNQNL